MNRDEIIDIISSHLIKEKIIIFAYIFGSFVNGREYRDIDVSIYVRNIME